MHITNPLSIKFTDIIKHVVTISKGPYIKKIIGINELGLNINIQMKTILKKLKTLFENFIIYTKDALHWCHNL